MTPSSVSLFANLFPENMGPTHIIHCVLPFFNRIGFLWCQYSHWPIWQNLLKQFDLTCPSESFLASFLIILSY